MEEDKNSKIAGYIIMFSALGFPFVASIYSVIEYRSVLGFIFFSLMVDVIIMVGMCTALTNKLNNITKLINEQSELFQSKFVNMQNLIIQGVKNEKEN